MSVALPLRTTALRGLSWIAAAQGARQALQLGLRVLLVRLLSPDDFGLMAMVTVFSGLFLMFNDLGFGPALVRQAAPTEAELSAVFWVNLITGLLLALITAGLGPPLALFYSQPRLIPICTALSLASLIAPLGTVHTALLERRLAFRTLAAIDVTGLAAGGAVAVSLAVTRHGVWALVWQANVTALAVLAVTVRAARWVPRRSFQPGAAAALWNFSGRVTAASALNYCVRNVDNLLVGRFLGSAALGFYSQAYQLMLYPVQNIAAAAGRVMFPALASVQEDPDRVRRAYVRALRGIAALTFPLMLCAIVLAPDLYATLYGRRWEPSVFLFQVLCGLGMLQSIGTTVGWVYLTTGRADLMLRWTFITASLVLPGFLAGLRLAGLQGLTVSYVVTSGLLFVPSLCAAFRLIHLPLGVVARQLAPILAAAAGTAALISVLRWLLLTHSAAALPWRAGPAVRLLAGAALGIASYLALLQAFRQEPLTRARGVWAALRQSGT